MLLLPLLDMFCRAMSLVGLIFNTILMYLFTTLYYLQCMIGDMVIGNRQKTFEWEEGSRTEMEKTTESVLEIIILAP